MVESIFNIGVLHATAGVRERAAMQLQAVHLLSVKPNQDVSAHLRADLDRVIEKVQQGTEETFIAVAH
jgi:hypothetical protein